REKNVVGLKARDKVGAIGGPIVNAAEDITDSRGEIDLDRAIAELRFPKRMSIRRKVGHRHRAPLAVLAENLGGGARADFRRDTHPFDLVAAPGNGSLPFRRNFEFGERPFDANDARRQVDAVDIRRYTTNQRAESNLLVSAHSLHATQRTE